MRPHSGIRATALVLAAVTMTVLAWLALRWFIGSGNLLPDPGWLGAVAMAFLAGGLIAAGRQVRRVRDGQPDAAITPVRAARTLVLSQAGALTGAALVGWYVANILVLLPDADVDSQRARIWPFVVHVVVALLLAAAGMVVQSWCRLRPRDDEDESETPR